MNLTPWKSKKQDPFAELLNWDHPFYGLTAFPNFGQLNSKLSDWNPALDVSEDEKHFHLKADLPGLKKEEINISADGTVLTIRGERKHEEEKKEKNFHRIERSYGSFQRSVDLGTYVDIEKAKAKYQDGVLEVTVPKTEHETAKKIRVE